MEKKEKRTMVIRQTVQQCRKVNSLCVKATVHERHLNLLLIITWENKTSTLQQPLKVSTNRVNKIYYAFVETRAEKTRLQSQLGSFLMYKYYKNALNRLIFTQIRIKNKRHKLCIETTK